MLGDTLNVVDMEQKLLGSEERIGGFDLLGCDNSDRQSQLNRVYREAAAKLSKEQNEE